MSGELRFGFGKNWENFVDSSFSKERVDTASRELLSLLHVSDLRKFTFLDIGCGSGIHSLAAIEAGAEQVVSFDYDINSVRTTKKLHEMIGKPSNWTIMQGSVLDKGFMENLGKFDIVYSWGVLHHTGAVWDALGNAKIPLSDNGVLAIALYSYTRYLDGSLAGWPTPEKWLDIKKRYNQVGFLGRKTMELQQLWRSSKCWQASSVGDFFCKLKEFAEWVKKYPQIRRGMSYMTDLKDWLGGWPMEFVKESECVDLYKGHGLNLMRIRTGEGNTEYVFRPSLASNYWDGVLRDRIVHQVNNSAHHESGYMWSVLLKDGVDGELNAFDNESLIFCVDGSPLAYGHSNFDSITELGDGRYKYVDGKVYFSTLYNKPFEISEQSLSYYFDR